ncbi:MAG: antiterminator LoaP [Clostridia bacterium]|nr:antiterminator LoaP [Clostridia bacterium]
MYEVTEDDPWFALFVKTNNEDTIKKNLEKSFEGKYKFYSPKRVIKERHKKNWVSVLKPLFSGYILFQGKFENDDYYKMKSIPDVYYLLKSEKGPLPLFKEEVQVLSRLLQNCEDDYIGISDLYMEGDAIYVMNGPLQAMEGIIISVNKRKGRAKVKLSVGGNEKLIDLSVNLLNLKP